MTETTLKFDSYKDYLEYVEKEWKAYNHEQLICEGWVVVDIDYGLGQFYRDLTEAEYNRKTK